MNRLNQIILIIVLILSVSCTGQIGHSVSRTKLIETKSTKNDIVVKPTVIWESDPHPIALGNDGQLLIRASESMNLLYAVPNKGGKQDLFLSKSRDIGESFSKPIQVNSEVGEVSAHGENGPKLRQGKGRGIFAAWIGNRDIKFSRSMNFGRSFSPSIKVNNDLGKASQSFFTMEVAPNGTIFLAWLDGRDRKTNSPGTSALYIARSSNNGTSFGKNIKIAGDVCPCCRPSIAFGDSGETFISWRHVYEENERKVVVASSFDNGITWSNARPVTTTGWKINGCPHSGPTLSFNDGNLLVAWYSGVGRKARLKFARSVDKGLTFESTADIHGDVLDPNHPHMEEIGRETWIIFQGRDPRHDNGWGSSKAWIVRIGKDGKAKKPEVLPTQGGGVNYPYLFSGTGGRVYALWTEFNDDGHDVILCRGRIRLDG